MGDTHENAYNWKFGGFCIIGGELLPVLFIPQPSFFCGSTITSQSQHHWKREEGTAGHVPNTAAWAPYLIESFFLYLFQLLWKKMERGERENLWEDYHYVLSKKQTGT